VIGGAVAGAAATGSTTTSAATARINRAARAHQAGPRGTTGARQPGTISASGSPPITAHVSPRELTHTGQNVTSDGHHRPDPSSQQHRISGTDRLEIQAAWRTMPPWAAVYGVTGKAGKAISLKMRADRPPDPDRAPQSACASPSRRNAPPSETERERDVARGRRLIHKRARSARARQSTATSAARRCVRGTGTSDR